MMDLPSILPRHRADNIHGGYRKACGRVRGLRPLQGQKCIAAQTCTRLRVHPVLNR
jgi:hypothetical protein